MRVSDVLPALFAAGDGTVDVSVGYGPKAPLRLDTTRRGVVFVMDEDDDDLIATGASVCEQAAKHIRDARKDFLSVLHAAGVLRHAQADALRFLRQLAREVSDLDWEPPV